MDDDDTLSARGKRAGGVSNNISYLPYGVPEGYHRLRAVVVGVAIILDDLIANTVRMGQEVLLLFHSKRRLIPSWH